MISKTKQLRKLIASNKVHIAPGVFDGLSARLVEQAGFNLIYASGGAIARSTGYPDLGLLGIGEITKELQNILEVTTLPVIADADTGFGNIINVRRTVKLFENLGVVALHLEDQEFPKRCGHLEGKQLVSKQEMIDKIRIARESLVDPDFVLIARTDAIAVEGFDQAIDRAQAYLLAGADMIFVEAPQTEEQVKLIAKKIPEPKLINMFYGGKTPLIPISKLESWGYNIVVIPSDLQRSAIYAMQKTLAVIKEQGDSASISDQLVTFNEREKIIGTANYLALGRTSKEK